MQATRQISILLLLVLLALASGCAINKATGGLTPGVELQKSDNYYVVRHANDKYDVNLIITKQLTERGFHVTTGPAEAMPADTAAEVKYLDRWMWDITLYMLELTITISDAKSGFTLATGNSYHTSLTRKSPEEMVREVLNNMLSGSTE